MADECAADAWSWSPGSSGRAIAEETTGSPKFLGNPNVRLRMFSRRRQDCLHQTIAAIQPSSDVNSSLRLAIHELFERRIEDQLSLDDLRADELPESLPVMNLRTMTGGE